MITVSEQTIKEIPCLVVTKDNLQEAPLQTVIYYHGFTSAKEHNLPLAFLLARKNFRIVLPDSYLHGEREESISVKDFQLSFWDIVIKNIEELNLIKEYLDENGLIKNEQIGIAGTSMGGITTSAALRKYAWVKAGAVLMGSPKLLAFADDLITVFEKEYGKPLDREEFAETFAKIKKLDLAKDITSLAERPLFIWHGDADTVVPFKHAYNFYQKAKEYYDNEELIQFSREKNRDHKVSRAAILSTVSWFENHLKT